jgi:hypothetical protein
MSLTKAEVHVSPMNIARHYPVSREDVFALQVFLLKRALCALLDDASDIAHIV